MRRTKFEQNSDRQSKYLKLLSYSYLDHAYDRIGSRKFKSFHRLVISTLERKMNSHVSCHEFDELTGQHPELRSQSKLRGRSAEATNKATKRQEISMNHSIYSADRTTHLKVVVVALVAGIALAGLGISARSTDDGYTQTARVIKAGSPVALTSADTTTVR